MNIVGLNTTLTQDQARTIARDYLWQFVDTRAKAAEAVELCCRSGTAMHTSSVRDLIRFAIGNLDHVPAEHRAAVLKEALSDLNTDDYAMLYDVAAELMVENG